MNAEIKDALESVIDNSTGSCASYAVSYAQAAFDHEMEGEALRVQLLYVLCNLDHWRGEEARRVKTVLRTYSKK